MTLQQRIGIEVSAYIEPAARAVRIRRDTLHHGALRDQLPLVETFAGSLLREIPQMQSEPRRRERQFRPGSWRPRRRHRGQARRKRARTSPSPGSIATPAGDKIGREEDPTDTYDPRTRPWYVAALATDHLFWTGIYVFFSQRVPGITASAKCRDPNGRLYLLGVDITLDALSHFLASLEIGRTGRAVIIDDTGQLIAAPRASTMLHDINGELAAARVDELGDEVLTHAHSHRRGGTPCNRG